MIEFFPNTNPPRPVPGVLTFDEACMLLRLDEGRGMAQARRALRRLIERRLIRPARIGRYSRFSREELLRFVRWQTELSGEAPESSLHAATSALVRPR